MYSTFAAFRACIPHLPCQTAHCHCKALLPWQQARASDMTEDCSACIPHAASCIDVHESIGCTLRIASARLYEMFCCQGADVDSLLVAVIGSCGIARVHEGACLGKILSSAPAHSPNSNSHLLSAAYLHLARLKSSVTAAGKLNRYPCISGQQAGRSPDTGARTEKQRSGFYLDLPSSSLAFIGSLPPSKTMTGVTPAALRTRTLLMQ